MSIRPGQTIMPVASMVRVALQLRLRADADDALAANPQIGDAIEILRGIDDAAVGDAEEGHRCHGLP